jgi:hypothetical protein
MAFHWELMKLLLQVAWADDEVVESEHRIVLGLGERLGLSSERMAELTEHLTTGKSLPPPDLGVLRARKHDALHAAEQLVLADDEISDEENLLLAELTALLGGGEDPSDDPQDG